MLPKASEIAVYVHRSAESCGRSPLLAGNPILKCKEKLENHYFMHGKEQICTYLPAFSYFFTTE